MKTEDYQYDIFVSYVREGGVQWWVELVVDQLTTWLKLESLIKARVFVDHKTIRPGAHWPSAIRQAALSSKCLVAFLSAPYFFCDWCRWEWGTFQNREVISNCSLILPLQCFDGDHYPLSAKESQLIDLRDCTSTVKSFRKGRGAEKLDSIVKTQVAPAVARLIRGAPPFSDGWPGSQSEPPSKPDVPLLGF